MRCPESSRAATQACRPENTKIAATGFIRRPRLAAKRSVERLQILGRHLPAFAVGDEFEAHFLTFVQRAHARAFNGADMHESIAAAAIRSDKPKTLLGIKPFNGSRSHKGNPFTNRGCKPADAGGRGHVFRKEDILARRRTGQRKAQSSGHPSTGAYLIRIRKIYKGETAVYFAPTPPTSIRSYPRIR